MSDESKTLEQRHQMTDLERLRHSAAHVLATAILNFSRGAIRRRSAGGQWLLYQTHLKVGRLARKENLMRRAPATRSVLDGGSPLPLWLPHRRSRAPEDWRSQKAGASSGLAASTARRPHRPAFKCVGYYTICSN